MSRIKDASLSHHASTTHDCWEQPNRICKSICTCIDSDMISSFKLQVSRTAMHSSDGRFGPCCRDRCCTQYIAPLSGVYILGTPNAMVDYMYHSSYLTAEISALGCRHGATERSGTSPRLQADNPQQLFRARKQIPIYALGGCHKF